MILIRLIITFKFPMRCHLGFHDATVFPLLFQIKEARLLTIDSENAVTS